MDDVDDLPPRSLVARREGRDGQEATSGSYNREPLLLRATAAVGSPCYRRAGVWCSWNQLQFLTVNTDGSRLSLAFPSGTATLANRDRYEALRGNSPGS